MRFLILIIFFSMNAQAKSVGFGVMLGSPTGLSAKYNINNSKGIDFAASWKLSGDEEFYFHSDYLIKKNNFFKVEKAKFHLFFGGGVKLVNRQKADTSSELSASLRIPFGLSYNLNKYRLEFFGELVPVFDFAPDSGFGFDIGLGLRYYL